ncbi:hypothetical protein lbkm_0608 [Lachnospiraceae bacterium KM106-2]|nr:hypothetical protein lbkm_0608 [Lachnospiraceae bacterium KM106-2]
MDNYNFYYDESEHSRRLTLNTITAENYYDNFVVVIVGCEAKLESTLFKRYEMFEEKYAHRKSKGELKSLTIRQNQLENGFATLNRDNVNLLSDFLSIFDDSTLIYFSVASKIEYMVSQLFDNYHSNLFQDAEAMKYSIVKAILTYRPKEILEGIYQNSQEFIELLKSFFKKRIELNQSNMTLKKQENESFNEILLFLDDVSIIKTIDWNYKIAFIGFAKYLDEMNISRNSIIIDREGEHENTVGAARSVGLCNVSDEDSKKSCGVRMADMLVGLITKLSKALHKALCYDSIEEQTQKKLLSKKWFELNEAQFLLYKKMYTVICKLNNAWYKSYAGIYADDLVVLVSILNYMNHFDSYKELKNSNIDMLGEYFNAYACDNLKDYFVRMRRKLPVEYINDNSEDFFTNQKGAKIFYDINKQPKINFVNGKSIYYVLSVGFKEKVPLVTVMERDEPKCYRLLMELSEWAVNLVAFVNLGMNMFPGKVMFSKVGDMYYADVM